MSEYDRHTELDSIDKTGLYRLALYLFAAVFLATVLTAVANDAWRTVVMDRCIEAGNDPRECREAAHG